MTTDKDGSPCAEGDLYALALRTGHGPVYLRLADGCRIRMPVHRWYAHPTVADESVLNRCVGPVLDVGCGPGRHCRALLGREVFALGVDGVRGPAEGKPASARMPVAADDFVGGHWQWATAPAPGSESIHPDCQQRSR
ncbi:hypothetical protein ACIRP2_38020 [Streptomyces sp. NPDC101194]|uniref:hypothetical protein n=1 Tax=Streptomyces sp. NPDC101194 TaxID=3366127 RepID=UPI003809772F